MKTPAIHRLIVLVGLALALAGAPARAQFYDAGSGGAEDEPEDGDANSAEGLQSATPTDNVNELGNGGPNSAGGDGAVEDFPAAGAQSNDMDFGDGGGEGGDGDLFGNGGGNAEPVGGEGAVPSAFGDDPATAKPKASNSAAGNPAAANPAAANPLPANPAASPETLTPALTNQAPPANLQPAETPPADAQTLMNQISTEPAPGTPADPAAPIAGDQPLVQPPAEPPPIEAPPLPPPNEFAGAPPVPGTMRLMAEGEAPEEYAVQPGDTLFDICDQLLDEPGYWPKLWALNPEIKNPHFIFPNMRLKFYPGDDETPPYLQVVTEDDVIPIDKGDLDEQELVAEKVIFPEDGALDEQITEVIGPDQVEPLEDEILTAGTVFDGTETAVQVPGFIFSEAKEPVAVVLGGRTGEISLAPGKKALVEATGDVSVGTLYTVLRPGEEISDPESGDFVGYKYYFIANVRIEKGVDDSIYVATVQENNRLGVQAKDILVDFISTMRSVPSTSDVGSVASADARVVGWQYAGQDIGAAGNFAFLDRGNGDGISTGMYLPIYQTPGFLTSAFGATDLPEDYELVGYVRIIDTTDAGAVGYVVRNTKEMRIGDRTDKG